ncbi:hypothetical protein BC008_13600 [Mastigocoleus testarum BC008]|uniref:Uncharacterized protein n=1 Tax=Mastigocoleus testarum BC008 TaxID=371196 RepID=A0A0V7ZFZ3_9CYAN|nr:hypothetical protein BC008_13600 [Mastigocoleus testarum BC008]
MVLHKKLIHQEAKKGQSFWVHYLHSHDLWKDAPLTRFEALKIMTTKVDKADGTGNFTHVEAIREFSKWKEEGSFLSQLELLKAIS